MPDDPQNDKKPEDPLRVELIKHLSAEITSGADFLHTFRSRMAFNVLLGPFLVLGSIVVAATKITIFWPKGFWPWFGLSMAIFSYIALGFFGFMLDRYLTWQNDFLRCRLLFVAKNRPLGKIRFRFPKKLRWRHWLAYIPGFAIVILAFTGIAIFFLALVTQGESAPQPTPGYATHDRNLSVE
jgi:hypothetical protein